MVPLSDKSMRLLVDVEAGHVYQVNQRSAQYAMNERTYGRVTREVKILLSAGVVRLGASSGSDDGVYELTNNGRATLAAERAVYVGKRGTDE